MNDHDLNGRKYTKHLKSVQKSNHKFVFEEIKAASLEDSEEEGKVPLSFLVIDTSSQKKPQSVSQLLTFVDVK